MRNCHGKERFRILRGHVSVLREFHANEPFTDGIPCSLHRCYVNMLNTDCYV